MTHLVESIALVVCASLAAYCFLQWLAVFKRRNDLMDRFQGFERGNTEAIEGIRSRLAGFDDVAQHHQNLVGSHERLVARVTELDAYVRKEISQLGGSILEQVGELKTQQAAAWQATQRMPNVGRPVIKP